MNALAHLPTRYYAYAIAAIWAILTLPSLGLAPLFDYDETIYAQTAADMMHLGEWIVPTANGMQFFEKPPFTYYMMDMCYVLFGENAFAARLPSAIFTLLTALLLFRFGRDTHSSQFGLAAALIFLSMFEVSLLAHAAILDSVLNFFIAACLLNYFRWIQTGDKRHALWCAAMMGVGVSIKGPVGVVVPVLIIALERLFAGDLKRTLGNIPWLTALGLFFITATPWYLMIWLEHGIGFLYEFIMVQNIGRALKPMQGHGGAWHYYIVVFMVSVLPWLALIPAIIKRWHRTSSEPMDMLIRLSLIWTLVVLILFTFAQTKLPHYISCIYPAVALALTAAWWRQQGAPSRPILSVTSIILIPLALILIAFPMLYPSIVEWVHHPRAIAVLSQDIQPGLSISIGGILLLTSLVWMWRSQHILHAFIIVGFILQSALLIPAGSFAGKLAQGPQSHIAIALKALPENTPIFSYNLNFPSISFQSQRSYQIVLNQPGMDTLAAQTSTYAIICRTESLSQLTSSLPHIKHISPIINQGGFLLFVLQNEPNI